MVDFLDMQRNLTQCPAMRSLNQLKPLRSLLHGLKFLWLTRIWGMDIHPSCQFSLSAKFDLTYPRGIHVGARSYIAFGAVVMTHDMVRGLYTDTWIGRDCFIGARSIVMPGIRIGDGSIVGAGSIVTRDVPAGSIAAGNPARVIRDAIGAGAYGCLPHIQRDKA